MIIDIVNKLLKPVIIIACISMVLTWAFNIENQLIHEEVYNGITIKVLDFRTYLQNINNAWSTTALNFQDILPSRTIQSTNNLVNDISNNILTIFDWLYFPINFVLYIIRWLAWIIKMALALIGWNVGYNYQTEKYYSVLVEILTWVTQNLMIPYV